MISPLRVVLLCALLAFTSAPAWAYTQTDLKTAADSTIETIPLEATVQETPPAINIKTYAAGTFSIYRKAPSDLTWGTPVATGVTLGIEAVWTDANVAVGTLYEYRFVNTAGTAYNSIYPSGYILCGIKVDQTQPRGRMAVLVTPEVIASLPAEYAQYKADLVSDGWTVSEIPVPRCANSYVGLGNGAMATIKINNGGSGFVNGDTVYFTNAAGRKAAGKLTAATGTITAITIPAGAAGMGFAVNDQLTVSGGTAVGSGATLQAHVNTALSTLGSASPISGGAGYIDGQAVTLTGQTSGKTAQCTLHAFNGALSYFTIVSSQTTFVVGELLTMTGNTSGSGAGPMLVSSVNSGALQGVSIRPPGVGYAEGDLVTLTGSQSGKTAQAILHLNGIYISYFTISSSDQGFISGEKLTLSGGSGTGAGPCSASVTAPLLSVTVTTGGSGYVDGNVVTIKYGSATAQGTLHVTGGAVTGVTVTSSGSGFYEGGSLSLSGLQTTATGYNLTVLTVDNSNTGRAATVNSGGAGYLDNDIVTLRGGTSGATMRASIVASGGVISRVSAVLPNTFTPGETLTITTASSGSGFTGLAGPSSDLHLLIRSAVQGVYNAYPGELKNIVLLGKIPTLRTGIDDGFGSDGHGNEAPYGADAFYADMDSVVGVDWTDTQDNLSNIYTNYNLPGDNQFDQQTIFQVGNGAVELGFGRIDLSLSIQTENEALRTYFNKLHRYKIASADFRPGRLVCDRATFGYPNEREANLQALPGVVGMNQIQFIKGTDLPPVSAWQDADALYTTLHGPYLFYIKGSGGPVSAVDSKAVFWTGMQSHWGYWYMNNTMPLRLAEDSYTLSYTWNIWGMRYIYHRLGMGLDTGDMMKQSINNRGWGAGPYSYKFNNTSNGDYHGSLYMNHMGDPALRLFMFEPPSALSVVKTAGRPALSWAASPDSSVIGYHIYRAANAAAPFTRLTPAPVAGTSYTDATVGSGSYVYMVRAVHLETTGGGTFYNPSLGAVQSVNLDATPTPISIQTTSLPSFGWSTAASVALSAQGGVPQYVWSLTSGTLPAGLTLAPNGVLAGTPTVVGTFPITVTATDQIAQTASQALSIVVSSNRTTVLRPTATTYTNKSTPTTVYGTYEAGLITGSATYMYETFHRYDLSGVTLNNGFAKATLYLYVTSGTTVSAYAPVLANLIADAQDGWSDTGTTKAFTGYVNNGAGNVRIICPAHGFLNGMQVTLAGLTGTNAPTGPYPITVVDADKFDIPVAYAAWTYTAASALASTTGMIYDNRPTSYNPNVPTIIGQGSDTASGLLQFDVTSFVRETLRNDPAKQMSIRFFTGTPQTVATGTLRAFGGAIPYLVLETTNAPRIDLNSPAGDSAALLTGSSLLLDTTVSPVPGHSAALQWTQVAGPGTVTFSQPTAASTSASFSTPGDYTVRLAATDGPAQSFRDITVRVLTRPVTGPTDSLVLRMALDETSGTVAQDSSGVSPANNGTLTGTPLPSWTTAGEIGGGLSFPGSGQRVDIPDSTTNLLDGMKQLTISVWFKAASLPVTPNYAALVSKRVAAFNNESYILELRGNTGANSTLYAYVAGGTSMPSTALIVPGQWYHAVMVFNGNLTTNNLQLWINGTPDKFSTIVPNVVPRKSTANLRIGALDAADTLGFNGTIDEVRIYNRALTLTEIQDLYAAVPANVAPVVTTAATVAGATGQPLNLSATVLDDNKPSPSITYQWSVLSGPGAFNLASPGALTTTGTPSLPGTYTLQFAANDGSIVTTANVVATITGQTFDSWIWSNGLTGANALASACPANDGISNLQKYAWGLNPATSYPPGSAGLPKVLKQTVGGADYLALSFIGTATDVKYVVQATSDLTQPWTDLQTYPPGAAPGSVTVRDSKAMSESENRFLRLLVTKP